MPLLWCKACVCWVMVLDDGVGVGLGDGVGVGYK